jgi:hypothetical protein
MLFNDNFLYNINNEQMYQIGGSFLCIAKFLLLFSEKENLLEEASTILNGMIFL